MAARSRAVLLILWFALIVIPWSGGWAQEYPVSLRGDGKTPNALQERGEMASETEEVMRRCRVQQL